MKLTSFALLLSLSTSAFAAMTDVQLAQSMRAELAKSLVTVKAPKLIFHWVDASDIMPAGQYNASLPAIGSSFTAYVDKQGSKIFRARSGKDYDIEGPGLYLASDPLSTRAYGGQKSFGLIVGLLRPGAKIVPGDRQLDISNSIVSEMSTRGCAVTTYNELLDVADSPKCTKIKQLLVGADISFADARIYSYGTGEIEGCRSRSPFKELAVPAARARDYEGNDTFVAYSSRAFTEIMGITHKTTISKHALSNEVLSYLKGLQVHNLIQYAQYAVVSAEQLANPAIKAMAKADIAKFSQKYIMGCNL